MPSTRKQKAREKRARQSDVMPDVENLDVKLGSNSRNALAEQENNSEIDLDLESGRQQQSTSRTDNSFRSLFNTKSEITAETNRMIISEVSSQLSRKLEEMKSDLNSHIVEVINSAIEEKILPSIENAVASNVAAKNTKRDLRSDGRHPGTAGQATEKLDSQSDRQSKSKFNQQTQCFREHFPRLIATGSTHINHYRDISVDSETNDDGYDMVTGTNLTHHMVPEFLTGRPMQSLNKTLLPHTSNDDTLDTNLPAQQIPVPATNRNRSSQSPVEPIKRLADVIMGMNNKSSARTLMVPPVKYCYTDFRWHTRKLQTVRGSVSHDNKDATGHDRNNENQPFLFAVAQNCATDLP